MDFNLFDYLLNMPAAAQLVFLLGAVFAISSFIARDILILRILFLIGTFLFMVAGIILYSPETILINFIHGTVNSVQIARLLMERYSFKIPEDLRGLYYEVFSSMNPKEFLELIHLGEKITTSHAKTEFLFQEGEVKDILIVTLGGEVTIEKNNQEIATLPAHSFIGEMHYLTKKPMSADVRIKDELTYIRWHHEQLDELKRKSPLHYADLMAILGQDLIHKVQNTPLMSSQH